MPDHTNAHKRLQAPKAREPQSWKFTDAKPQLNKVVLRALDGEPQRVVWGGRNAVIVIAEKAYKEATRPRRSVVELFSALRGIDLDLEREVGFGPEIPF